MKKENDDLARVIMITAKDGENTGKYIANAQVSITRITEDLGIWPDSMNGYQYFLWA